VLFVIHDETLGDLMSKRKSRPEEILEYAKKILPKCSNRYEVIKKTSEHFNMSPNTVSGYFGVFHFKTGFKRGLQKFWDEVKEGKREPPEQFQPINTLKFLSEVMKKPVWAKDYGYSSSIYYRILKRNGIDIRRFRVVARCRETKKRAFSEGKTTPVSKNVVYYMPWQKMEVYKMLKKKLGNLVTSNKRNILKSLGIPFVSKNGMYHTPEGEEL